LGVSSASENWVLKITENKNFDIILNDKLKKVKTRPKISLNINFLEFPMWNCNSNFEMTIFGNSSL